MVLPDGLEPPKCLGVGQMPLPLGEGSFYWCAAQDSNLQHAALETAASADWATGAYPRQASNLHCPAFKAGPLPVGLRG